MKHTPGPWKASSEYLRGRNRHSIIGNGLMICDTWDMEKQGEELANAHLIAAAPDLLEACKEFINEWHSNNANFAREEPKSLKMMRQAISKAEGRE